MKLTNYHRECFVNAVKADMKHPHSDHEQTLKNVKAAIYRAMSPEVTEVYNKYPNALHSTTIGTQIFERRREQIVVGNVDYEKVLQPFFDKVEQYRVTCVKIERIAKQCSTLKQLHDALPELAKYMPGNNSKVVIVPNALVPVGLINDLKKFGLPV